jgi:hypothetical protein
MFLHLRGTFTALTCSISPDTRVASAATSANPDGPETLRDKLAKRRDTRGSEAVVTLRVR